MSKDIKIIKYIKDPKRVGDIISIQSIKTNSSGVKARTTKSKKSSLSIKVDKIADSLAKLTSIATQLMKDINGIKEEVKEIKGETNGIKDILERNNLK
ncbi:MAG: hypothetical protein LBS95_02775 [Mycoplasmataceae bacterium]|jgi:hypothetical protein|nr:hypothetical protein [Mycoplasmataceae bacterium]